MKIENPYTELMKQQSGTRIEGCWSGWEEGYHSRDEVVSGLVGASYALWLEVDRVGFPLGIKPATLVTAMGNLMGVLSTTPEAFKTYADYEAAEVKARP